MMNQDPMNQNQVNQNTSNETNGNITSTPQPQVVAQPTQTTLPPVNTVSQDKSQKRKNIFLVLLIIFLFAFVFFLPDITNLFTRLKNEREESKTKTPANDGIMRCYLTKSMTGIDYTVETKLTYKQNKLKKQTIITTYKQKDQTEDSAILLEKKDNCEKLKAALANMDGMSVSCKLDQFFQETTQEINYQRFNREEMTTNIAEFEGYYPSYALDEDITGIKTKMEQAGYTCTRKE